MYLLLIIGIAILVALSLVAVYYVSELHQQNQRQQQAADLLAEKEKDSRKSIENSIHVLCRAMVDEQVTLTEGCIRVNGLLKVLQLEQKHTENLSAFALLSDEASHIPILDEWRELSSQKKREFDMEREKLEEKYRDFVIQSSRYILDNDIFEINQVS